MCVSFLQIFSIVVFATITAEGYINPHSSGETKCMFNQNDSACNYGVGIGVLAFMACVVMLIIDANFPQMSNAKQRKIIVLGDLVFSGEGPVSHLSPPKCFPPHVCLCFDGFIVGQRCGRSCGSSVSVSWPTSGPIPRNHFMDHVTQLGPWWPSPSFLSSAG